MVLYLYSTNQCSMAYKSPNSEVYISENTKVCEVFGGVGRNIRDSSNVFKRLIAILFLC